jgi:hypothetical protein
MFNVDWVSSFRSTVSTQRFVNAFKKQVSSRSSLIGKSRQDAFGQSFAAGGAHPELRRWTTGPFHSCC